MPAPHDPPPAGTAAPSGAAAEPPRISEIVLRTSRFDAMKAWYQEVLGVTPFYEHLPPDWERRREAQDERLPKDLRLCFMRVAAGYPFGQIVALFDVARLAPSPRASGLHHMQFRHGSLEALFARFERLSAKGILPYQSFNHGPATSFYYEDPDTNLVELSAANFATEGEYIAYMQSDSFKRNPVGVEIDAGAFVGRFRRGEPLADLVRLPV